MADLPVYVSADSILVSSYFEKITEDFERLDDPTWSALVSDGPSDVPWISSLLAR